LARPLFPKKENRPVDESNLFRQTRTMPPAVDNAARFLLEFGNFRGFVVGPPSIHCSLPHVNQRQFCCCETGETTASIPHPIPPSSSSPSMADGRSAELFPQNPNPTPSFFRQDLRDLSDPLSLSSPHHHQQLNFPICLTRSHSNEMDRLGVEWMDQKWTCLPAQNCGRRGGRHNRMPAQAQAGTRHHLPTILAHLNVNGGMDSAAC
jgi:hypothetical protein